MSWWDKRPSVYAFSYDGDEYEIQHDEKTGLYALFMKHGFYSWEQCSYWHDTPQGAFQDMMSAIMEYCMPNVKGGEASA